MTSASAGPDPDPDLKETLRRERVHHDRCRAALAAMVDGAQRQVVVGEDVSASGADAEVLGYQLRSQAKEMRELPEGPLFFGKLDFDRGDHSGQRYHLGRLRITEHPAAPPLVVDWRAPSPAPSTRRARRIRRASPCGGGSGGRRGARGTPPTSPGSRTSI